MDVRPVDVVPGDRAGGEVAAAPHKREFRRGGAHPPPAQDRTPCSPCGVSLPGGGLQATELKTL